MGLAIQHPEWRQYVRPDCMEAVCATWLHRGNMCNLIAWWQYAQPDLCASGHSHGGFCLFNIIPTSGDFSKVSIRRQGSPTAKFSVAPPSVNKALAAQQFSYTTAQIHDENMKFGADTLLGSSSLTFDQNVKFWSRSPSRELSSKTEYTRRELNSK
ncbi:unnamed protein product [Sphagnum jensenii]